MLCSWSLLKGRKCSWLAPLNDPGGPRGVPGPSVMGGGCGQESPGLLLQAHGDSDPEGMLVS